MDVICRIALGQRGTRQFANPNIEVCKRLFYTFGFDGLSIFGYLLPWSWSFWFIRRLAICTASFRNDPFVQIIGMLYKEVEERKKLRVG
jgi:hypothetical protein